VIESELWLAAGDVTLLADAAAQALARHPSTMPALAPPAEACVAFSDDAAVRDLNARFRQQDKATNVLSFPATPGMPAEPGQGRPIGDIVLAAGVVAAEADALGIPVAHHIQHLVVHGLLHLLGYDHMTEAEAVAMEALETEILASLNIPDPHSLNT
jgi:probable rRNA maturation factor